MVHCEFIGPKRCVFKKATDEELIVEYQTLIPKTTIHVKQRLH